jgi:hypothetical protein
MEKPNFLRKTLPVAIRFFYLITTVVVVLLAIASMNIGGH